MVGGYANVNVALPGHTLQGVLLIYETRSGSDRILNFYGEGGGPIQNPRTWLGRYFGEPMNEWVWTRQANQIGPVQ